MAQLGINKTAPVPVVDEPGGNVDFTIEIVNQFAETLTLTAIDDELALRRHLSSGFARHLPDSRETAAAVGRRDDGSSGFL